MLLVVNAASGELTVFKVTNAGVEFGSKVLSGGDFPVSVGGDSSKSPLAWVRSFEDKTTLP